LKKQLISCFIVIGFPIFALLVHIWENNGAAMFHIAGGYIAVEISPYYACRMHIQMEFDGNHLPITKKVTVLAAEFGSEKNPTNAAILLCARETTCEMWGKTFSCQDPNDPHQFSQGMGVWISD
jgi:hypothetical protein